MVNDWELPTDELAKLPRPRFVAAVVEGAIIEFEENGDDLNERLFLMCTDICHTYVQNINDCAYEQDFKLWVKTLDSVCAKRGIEYNAKAVCDSILSEVRRRARKESPKRKGDQKPICEPCIHAPVVSRPFEEHLCYSDQFHARGMGIRL